MIKSFLTYSLLFLVISFQSMGQSQGQYLKIADKCFESRDYVCAALHYKTALAYDSTDLAVLFPYAEALRLSNEYNKALFYYQKIYKKDGGREYPKAVFWLATMQKINGDYLESYKTWKQVKTIYRKSNSYENIKAKQEIKASAFARRAEKYRNDARVKNVGNGVNTAASEISPVTYQNQLYFASLRAKNMGENGEVYDELYSFKLYQASEIDSVWKMKSELPMVVNSPQYEVANGSFNKEGNLFYYSQCDSKEGCDIWVANYENGKWKNSKRLGFNENNSTETHPMSCQIEEEEYLFFSSDRKGGEGGMDIWYTKKGKNDNFEKPINLGDKINSPDNEVTPFYDTESSSLFFSSDWHPGLGGFDVFSAKGKPETLGRPQNMGAPINSRWNDLYYFIDNYTEVNYLSSNRADLTNDRQSTCCNDIYSVTFPRKIQPAEIKITTLEELNKYLPVTLYFHNDRPNPRTTSKTTELNYLTTYSDYIQRLPDYEREYSQGLSGIKEEEAVLDIQDFFKEYVEKGVKDLELFTQLLWLELQKGTEIELTVKGFASPLAKTDYNVNLTGRRISSLQNYLNEYENGKFLTFINSSKLTFKEVPFGEYTASTLVSDNVNDKRNSVYSRAAALERKIEIQSVNYLNKKQPRISLNKESVDLGKVKKGGEIPISFTLYNNGNAPLIIENIVASCSCTVISNSQTPLLQGESRVVNAVIDTKELSGKQTKVIEIISNASLAPKEFVVTFELTENN